MSLVWVAQRVQRAPGRYRALLATPLAFLPPCLNPAAGIGRKREGLVPGRARLARRALPRSRRPVARGCHNERLPRHWRNNGRPLARPGVRRSPAHGPPSSGADHGEADPSSDCSRVALKALWPPIRAAVSFPEGLCRVERATARDRLVRQRGRYYDASPKYDRLAELLQDLHDSEISGSIAWLFDNACHAEVGCADTRTQLQHGSPSHSTPKITALALYPDSPFSEK